MQTVTIKHTTTTAKTDKQIKQNVVQHKFYNNKPAEKTRTTKKKIKKQQ